MNATDDGYPFDSEMRGLAHCVLRYTETGRHGNGAGPGCPNAQRTEAFADAARQLAACVLAYLPSDQRPGPVSETRPSFREIERYGLELRARAHQRYPHPTPEQREKIDAKIARLVKAFSEKGGNAENPQTGESSLPVESLPKPSPAPVPQRRRPPVASPPARVWDGPGLFPAF